MTSLTSEPGDDVPALFVKDGVHLVPTRCAIGPWTPDALHGGAVAAVFGSLLDSADQAVARINLDLFSTVRVAPLRFETYDVGGGRRVRRRTAVLYDEDRLVAQATALYARPAGFDVPDEQSELFRSLPVLSEAPPKPLALLPESRSGWPGFENTALALSVEHDGQSRFRGWFRLLVPAIAGERTSGLQIALAAADYTSGGTALVLSYKKWSFVSLDLTVHLLRNPGDDWIGLEAPTSMLSQTGIGIATSVLHDAAGAFGRCTQTQFVRPLTGR